MFMMSYTVSFRQQFLNDYFSFFLTDMQDEQLPYFCMIRQRKINHG